MKLTSCPCLLEVIIFSGVKHPFSIGYATESLVVMTSIQEAIGAVGAEAVELIKLVLGIGEEMGAFLETLRVGQISCRLTVGIPQTAKWREQPVSLKGNVACAQTTQKIKK